MTVKHGEFLILPSVSVYLLGNKHKRSFLKRFISITKGKREKKEADKSVMPSDDDPVANPVRKRRLHIKKRFSSKSYSNAVKNTPSDLTIKKSSGKLFTHIPV